MVLVEDKSVRLKRILAVRRLHEEVGWEFQFFPIGREELIPASIADHSQP
jgi:hypothetical protein